MGAATACTGPTKARAVLWRSACYTAFILKHLVLNSGSDWVAQLLLTTAKFLYRPGGNRPLVDVSSDRAALQHPCADGSV